MDSNLLTKYKLNYSCNEEDSIQQLLNRIYNYIDEPTRQFHRMRINTFVEILNELKLKKQIKSYDKALDIGCNCGFYSKLISDAGFSEVRGIDLDSPLIDIAKTEFSSKKEGQKISFDVFNAENLDESKVDFILCTEVIEHTSNPQKVIDIIHNKLSPGGIAVISLPNGNSYPYFLTKLSYKLRGKKIEGELYDHLQYPSHRSRKLFSFQDFDIIKTTGTNLFYWYFLHKLPGFPLINKLNYVLGKSSLLKNYTQFYFLVLKKH
ncbi:MAG: methyltransferase domain-containing protein [Bacteroidetes bacterium]|nr:methyltransferase domain-containing protein [Bacteroidota bacterium]MBK9413398.1 methyltransferase domain-containing protein [Bacteroidota bacterium]MBP6656921.1 methyltransferase domain-containing protein [Bacteroidia bacterium]